jgi:DNA-binding MarR family transcriptional regulator
MGLGESPRGFARRRFFDRLNQEGISPQHQSVLGYLLERIPRSLPELGNLSGASIPLGRVAPTLRELEEVGLVKSHSMDRIGRLFQITELGRKIHSLYHRFDRERLLKPLSRATIRRLGTGRWVSDKGLRDELFSPEGEADFQREMEMLTRVGLVDRRRHPSRFGVQEYRLSDLGTEVLEKDREVLESLERILSELDD